MLTLSEEPAVRARNSLPHEAAGTVPAEGDSPILNGAETAER
jgi:hypothetical protein